MSFRPLWKSVLSSIRILVILAVLTGIVYPAIVALTGRAFPDQAAGSLISVDGRVVGSHLIGQPFVSPGYFWSRPSATTPFPYNPLASAPSNLGPTSRRLVDAVRQRETAIAAANPGDEGAPPVDLITASASGLDPDISPAAAMYQVPRVAKARGLSEETVRDLVRRHTSGRQWGLLGEPRVNVLELNLALDSLGH